MRAVHFSSKIKQYDLLTFNRTFDRTVSQLNRNDRVDSGCILGWSIEASALEKTRPQPRISRVFEAEGKNFLNFRGSFEAEGTQKD